MNVIQKRITSQTVALTKKTTARKNLSALKNDGSPLKIMSPTKAQRIDAANSISKRVGQNATVTLRTRIVLSESAAKLRKNQNIRYSPVVILDNASEASTQLSAELVQYVGGAVEFDAFQKKAAFHYALEHVDAEISGLVDTALASEIVWYKKTLKDLATENYILRQQYEENYLVLKAQENHINARSFGMPYVFLEFPPNSPLEAGIKDAIIQELPKLPLGTTGVQLYAISVAASLQSWRCEVTDRTSGNILHSQVLLSNNVGWFEIKFLTPIQSLNNAVILRLSLSEKLKLGVNAPRLPLALSFTASQPLCAKAGDRSLGAPLAMRILVGPPLIPIERSSIYPLIEASLNSKVVEKTLGNIKVVVNGAPYKSKGSSKNQALSLVIQGVNGIVEIFIPCADLNQRTLAHSDMGMYVADISLNFQSALTPALEIGATLSTDQGSRDSAIKTIPYRFSNGWRLAVTAQPELIGRSKFIRLKLIASQSIESLEVLIHALRIVKINS